MPMIYGSNANIRKKKKGIEIKDLRNKEGKYGKFAKNEFLKRSSLLDTFSDDSAINKSPLKGIYRMILLFSVIYVCNFIAKRVNDEGLNLSYWQ